MLVLPQTTTQRTNKMPKREWGKRKRKLFCFFLLVTFFLAKSGLKLDLLLAMGPGILPHTCSCSQAAPACWSQCILQKINGLKLSSSPKRFCVWAHLYVWFMQKSCQNILLHQKSNLQTFLGHCRGWLTWRITIQKECWLKHFRSLGCRHEVDKHMELSEWSRRLPILLWFMFLVRTWWLSEISDFV